MQRMHVWAGLAMAARALGVPQDRVAAAGDSYSDVSMLEWAGLGIAMANAVQECKAAADIIAPANTEDGLAWAIERYVLPALPTSPLPPGDRVPTDSE